MTPIGLQEGGEIAANYEGIEVTNLDADADATTTDYVLKFLERVFIGASTIPMVVTATATATVEVNRSGTPR
ncbi:MAG: hypothetical protein JWR34_7408 [Mycobacterium sp.]|nr:hypothetical protein [Mycobacterium sp.]